MRLGHDTVIALGTAAILGLCGCGPKGTGDRPATVTARAVVTYNGAPVSGATVSFIADGGSHSASGVTNETGTANMGTFGEGDGVVPGKFKVTIRKTTITTTGGAQPAEKVESPDSDIPPGKVEQKEELPAKYADPGTSGLTAEVTAADTELKFDLTN